MYRVHACLRYSTVRNKAWYKAMVPKSSSLLYKFSCLLAFTSLDGIGRFHF